MPIETLQLTEGSESTMSSSEGGREIQLAKERLASAKARGESASKNFVAAKETKKQIAKATAKMMETATRGVNTAQLAKRTESLKAAEKRREVVNIDSDFDEEEEEGNSKKKRKGGCGPNESPVKSPIMKECNRILSKLKKADKSESGGIFSVPVNEDDNAPGYSNIITEPSDFGTIQARLDENEIEAPEFYRLVSLVFTNAFIYNPDADHFVHKVALKLQTIYEKERQIVQFAVGQRVLVWDDETNNHWQATILGRKEKNGIPGYNIHWKGAKRKKRGEQDWVSSDDITTRKKL